MKSHIFQSQKVENLSIDTFACILSNDVMRCLCLQCQFGHISGTATPHRHSRIYRSAASTLQCHLVSIAKSRTNTTNDTTFHILCTPQLSHSLLALFLNYSIPQTNSHTLSPPPSLHTAPSLPMHPILCIPCCSVPPLSPFLFSVSLP